MIKIVDVAGFGSKPCQIKQTKGGVGMAIAQLRCLNFQRFNKQRFSLPISTLRTILQRIYRQSRHHAVRQQAHCILLRAQGISVVELLKIFPVCSRKTLHNWFDEWETRGFLGLYNRPGRGRKPTFDKAQKAQIKRWAMVSPQQLKQVVEKIDEAWRVQVSTHTVKRVLKSMNMSWHRFRRTLGGRPDPQAYAQKCFELALLKRLADEGVLALYYVLSRPIGL